MSFDLATVAADLEERLAQTLPGWAVRNAELTAKTNSLAMLLTYEQLNVSCEFKGQRLTPNAVMVDFQLVLSAPETDPIKGSSRVFDNLPQLCRALDAMDDLIWSVAEKGRDNAGTFSTIPITVIAEYAQSEE